MSFPTDSTKAQGFGISLGLSVGLLGFACRAKPPVPVDTGPFMVPGAMQFEASVYTGSILSGPVIVETAQRSDTDVGADAQETALGWQIDVYWAQHFPSDELDSLASRWRLIVQPDHAEPVQGTSTLMKGAQIAMGDRADQAWEGLLAGEWGRIGSIGSFEGNLEPSQTQRLEWTLTEEEEDPDNFLREWPARQPLGKRFAVALEAYGPELQPAFLLHDLGAVQAGDMESLEVPLEGGRPDGPRMQAEWSLPNVRASALFPQYLFVVPNPFASVAAEALVVRLRWVAADGLQSPLASTTLLPAPTAPKSPIDESATLQALEAMQVKPEEGAAPVERRGPMLYLANQGAGPLTRDLVLTANETLLEEWIRLVPPADSFDTGDRLPWSLERAAWVVLARWKTRDKLSSEWTALLLRHAGEAGQYASTLESAAMQSADAETMERRLILENQLFLEDSKPGARVRAFDWLKVKGIQVPGFDPLQAKSVRRAALRAYEEQQTQVEESR